MISEIKYANHDEWLAIRHKYIGGSEAGAVIGMNPYKSAYTLWAEKTDKIPQFGGNLTTEVGAYLEEMVAQLFERETGKKVRRKNATMVNDLYPFACANVDRMVVGEKALLEIKTTNSIPIMRQCRGTEFPEAYYCQVVHYMAVTGLEKAYLAVLINCRDFKVFELQRDQAEIDALMKAEEEFWGYVQSGKEPPVDGTDSTSETLQTLYPNSDGSDISLDMYLSAFEIYNDISRQIKELTGIKDQQANLIKAYMGEAERGHCGDFKVTYGNQNRKSLDTDKLKKDHPEINLDDYYKYTTSRVFKITKKENK